MLKVEFRAMGTSMAAVLEPETLPAAHILQQVPDWFEEWEACLSRFRPESELNRLNASAGRVTPVSEILWQALDAALEAACLTGGLVTPTVLPALEAAGYDRSFELMSGEERGSTRREATREERGSTRDEATREEVVPAAWQQIERDARRRTVTLPPGARLDFGGSAKGWAAQQAARRLGTFGPALVDCGGDMAISGPLHSGRGWPVDVADPLHYEQDLGLLEIRAGAVATSGIDRRRWQHNGAWQHHIIDPRTGRPADTDLVSVTVLAPDAVLAEAAAKTVFILGSQAGLEWLAAHAQVQGLLALADGQILFGPGMQEQYWSVV